MDIYNFNDELSFSQEQFVCWLMSLKLLNPNPACVICNSSEVNVLRKNSSKLDSLVWFCNRCKCQQSLRNGSFFASFPKVPLKSIFRYLREWSNNQHTFKRISRTGILLNRVTARKLAAHVDDVAIKSLMTIGTIGKIGGYNKCVQVDESLFVKRKYNRGRVVPQRWVLGMLSMEHTPARPIFQVVPNRTASTLMSVIRHHVHVGTTLVTDCWRAYATAGLHYNHMTVNHSRNFVDPNTGAHTNNIECEWRHAKEFVKQRSCSNVNPAKLQAMLYVYMWYRWLAQPYPGGPLMRLLYDIQQAFPMT